MSKLLTLNEKKVKKNRKNLIIFLAYFLNNDKNIRLSFGG